MRTPYLVRLPSLFQPSGTVQAGDHPVRPALTRTTSAVPISTVGYECPPLAVGDRNPADGKSREVNRMRGTLVVERPRLVFLVDAQGERPGGDE